MTAIEPCARRLSPHSKHAVAKSTEDEMPHVLATGSEELLIALQTPTPRGHLGVPTLLWGPPGEGKTSFVESFQRAEFPVVTLIASIHDPTDFSGLPVYENGRMRFAPPEWSFAFEERQDGILFLDELTTAPPAVQAALLRVVLERRVGMKTLPDRVRIVAAANPPDQVAGGWELTPPLANRFIHLQWQLPGTTLADALQEGFASPQLPAIDAKEHRHALHSWRIMTAAFLRRDPSLSHTQPADGEYAFASPRTWDYAIHLMASCDVLGKAAKPGGKGSAVFYSLLQSSVGSGAAKAFVGYLKNLRLPNPEDVLDGNESVDVEKLKDDELHVLFCSLASSVRQRDKKKTADRLLDAMLVVLELVHRVDKSGRVDAVFAPVRQLMRDHVLTHATAAAHRSGRLQEFQTSVKRVFDGTPLAEYVQIVHSEDHSAENE
jgi:hypothetical protein